jgi:hypothetical protein
MNIAPTGIFTEFVNATRAALAQRDEQIRAAGFTFGPSGQALLRSLHDLWDDDDFAAWRKTSSGWAWEPNADEDYEHLTIIVQRPGQIGWVAADIDVSDIGDDDLSVEGLTTVLARCAEMGERLAAAADALPRGAA